MILLLLLLLLLITQSLHTIIFLWRLHTDILITRKRGREGGREGERIKRRKFKST